MAEAYARMYGALLDSGTLPPGRAILDAPTAARP